MKRISVAALLLSAILPITSNAQESQLLLRSGDYAVPDVSVEAWNTNEVIDDQLNEWERIDSAGYSLPFDEEQVLIQNVLKTENNLNSNRINIYFQDDYSIIDPDKHEIKLSGGVRYSYWSRCPTFCYYWIRKYKVGIGDDVYRSK